MDQINQLSDLFRRFPGIGPRQAKRFVYFLINSDEAWLNDLVKRISALKKEIKTCEHCGRHFTNQYRPEQKMCKICDDPHRDHSLLLVVEKDVDLEAIEKTGSYHGDYFVLGGNVPILDPEPEKHIRFHKLLDQIKKKSTDKLLTEIIIALSATAEGDHTADWLSLKLENLKTGFKLTRLGRGLSTGSELEYADANTLKNALQNRQ